MACVAIATCTEAFVASVSSLERVGSDCCHTSHSASSVAETCVVKFSQPVINITLTNSVRMF